MTNINQAINDIDQQIEDLEGSISETTQKLANLRKAKGLLEAGLGFLSGATNVIGSANKTRPTVLRKRELTDEARKKISDRMAARWAAKRATSFEQHKQPPPTLVDDLLEAGAKPPSEDVVPVEEPAVEESTPKKGNRLSRRSASPE